MTSKTITRAKLSDVISKNVGISQQESSGIIENILNEISESLVKGEDVKISGFGTFSTSEKAERMGRNPKTKEKAIISARRSLKFKASKTMKKAVE